ncbi:ComEC/Rec2 family competence protein [Sinorhizobium prairiense]|uniref:ComEC/Rec2 family competence protein n=1 Tax=unclassified Sinorhizobium TaxID=2613772 RepID=UPI0023D8ADA7|nr:MULTISPECIES: MBL fold metallo-hydrolase [unclassified Sinorhizobium]WEJ08440.1 metallohydrolase [Sinorhizobium sp. M103]WEJ14055.1 metallohydrolase [Sinorhizobium sp. K101]WEJ35656.1 metallohydrolase [Sinorhizobium sp. C101]
MARKLLVRAFDVGLGDCIYCRIPDAHEDDRDFHILIDCGSWSGMQYLEAAVGKLKQMLPAVGGKRRLDLLVVTHQHKDHIAGFGPSLWNDISIGAIWMSAAMNPKHAQAEGARKLHAFAGSVAERAAGLNLAPELTDLFTAYEFDNDTAMTTLRTTLPATNNIQPIYVHAGMSTGSSLQLPLKGARLNILGPENDIDHFYLGDPKDPNLQGVLGMVESLKAGAVLGATPKSASQQPSNISASDFQALRTRMLSAALAFADLDGKVTNNTSVILLIEWRDKRLLFVGDAEWDAAFVPGKGNGSWNTMWAKSRALLDNPVDFLKVGHHGSTNATPWDDDPGRHAGKPNEPLDILNAVLPRTGSPTAFAIVSTERGRYKTIPEAALLVELGTRIANKVDYATALAVADVDLSTINKFEEFEKPWIGHGQPPRTDFNSLIEKDGYIDVEIPP